jgi:hypothetical protein
MCQEIFFAVSDINTLLSCIPLVPLLRDNYDKLMSMDVMTYVGLRTGCHS